MKSNQLLSRRRFLAVATGSAATCASVCSVLNAQSKPSPPQNLRFETPSRAMLNPSDFEYLGSFYVDNEGTDSSFQRGLTHRYVSGNLRLYVTGLSRELYEHSVPDLKTSGFNKAPRTNGYGNLVGASLPAEDPGSWPQIRGLYWDEPDQRMYWMFMPPYTGKADLSCLGYSILNDTNRTCSGIKAVKMPSGYGFKWVKGITPIPSWFSSQYTKGYRLGVGFGGYESLMGAGGGVSLGPVLKAVDPADIANTPHQGNLTNIVTCVGYSCHGNDRTAPWRGRRDKDYYFTGEPSWQPGEEPYGWFTWTDHIAQAGYWIDTGTKHGFLVLAFLSSLAGGSLDHLSSKILTSTTSSCTLASPIPGMRLDDYVVCSNIYKAIQVTSMDSSKTQLGLRLAPHSGDTGPLPSPPTGNLTRASHYVDAALASVASKVQAFVYDPSELSRGAMGNVPADLVQWNNTWQFDIPWMTQPTGSWWSQAYSGEVRGLTFDSKTNLLFVMVQNQPPIVSVYQVG